MNRTLLFSLSLLAALAVAGCQVSLWAGPVEDPYELTLPARDTSPTPLPTPAP